MYDKIPATRKLPFERKEHEQKNILILAIINIFLHRRKLLNNGRNRLLMSEKIKKKAIPMDKASHSC
jgi:hypothetical protein